MNNLNSFLLILMIFFSCKSVTEFDSHKWKLNENNYRAKVLDHIEDYGFLKNISIENYLEKLGEPKGSNLKESNKMISYQIESKQKNGVEVYFEYIQIFFNESGEFKKYHRDNWTIEKQYRRLKIIE